eukprot:15445112-Alexandrium_andersonii.AAC.1
MRCDRNRYDRTRGHARVRTACMHAWLRPPARRSRISHHVGLRTRMGVRRLAGVPAPGGLGPAVSRVPQCGIPDTAGRACPLAQAPPGSSHLGRPGRAIRGDGAGGAC